jgi:hypothetical protein
MTTVKEAIKSDCGDGPRDIIAAADNSISSKRSRTASCGEPLYFLRADMRRLFVRLTLTCSVSVSIWSWSLALRLRWTSCSCRISINRASIRTRRLATGCTTAATTTGTLRRRPGFTLRIPGTLPYSWAHWSQWLLSTTLPSLGIRAHATRSVLRPQFAGRTRCLCHTPRPTGRRAVPRFTTAAAEQRGAAGFGPGASLDWGQPSRVSSGLPRASDASVTPAMEAGLADHVWAVEELVASTPERDPTRVWQRLRQQAEESRERSRKRSGRLARSSKSFMSVRLKARSGP